MTYEKLQGIFSYQSVVLKTENAEVCMMPAGLTSVINL
jgi:hypothetical protein